MWKYFTLALLVSAGNGHAQTVFKCRDHRGQPVYQSFPCAADKPAEKIWNNEIREPTPAERAARLRAERSIAESDRKLRESNARYAQATRTYGGKNYKRDSLACVAAREEYERVQADFLLNRNIDLLRRLEAQIRDHCR